MSCCLVPIGGRLVTDFDFKLLLLIGSDLRRIIRLNVRPKRERKLKFRSISFSRVFFCKNQRNRK